MNVLKRGSDQDNWWQAYPGLYARELAAYEGHGASHRPLIQQDGTLILEVLWPMDSAGSIRLNVGYSPLHPFCRPSISAPELQLERHQNPFTRDLCLLTQDSAQWYPHQMVADFIAERLSQVLQVMTLRRNEQWSEAASLEEQAPDPVTPYHMHVAEEYSAVFFDGQQTVPNAPLGTAVFLLQDRLERGRSPPFQAILSKVEPLSGTWMAKPFDLPKRAGPWKNVIGRWIRLEPPFPEAPEEILAAAEKAIERQSALFPAHLKKLGSIADDDLSITAVVFQEELSYGPDNKGNGWFFLVSRRVPGSRRRQVSLVRGYRLSSDMLSRLPVASALKSKKVVLVGCGAIGSFAAVELARSGVGQLTIIDFDLVEPGNTVRWALGRSVWGLPKTTALHDFLYHNYPWTNVGRGHAKVGSAISNVDDVRKLEGNPMRWLRALIEDADIVVDTSASTECQGALAYMCRSIGKRYVLGHATEGAAGGVVARFKPGAPGCYVCLQQHWSGKTLPLPTIDSSGTIVPTGCNAPTFTGGAFDLQEVSMEVVRSTIGLLAPDVYDSGDWQLSILDLTENGRRILPRWKAETIAPHSSCSCGASQG
ncbi:hypothetical 65.2 kDa protein (plasmid) [Sinorhizobium fredii NGR234]|uniref:Uncharacterized protein y4oA n=1 Tax=Sinorhizobium fredii (strain NBRC 101917 / NGR234) TaxID=394 RepID=Y4OA_SINFN|nr:ThiF family adenylyltransferase [Sinorhizobium fredii]P55586.1 RecName: Full=Uncharacterized protein y4oA [Sinorhizobium fredii NGR234]AAB91794.1 hypothetical 65.2 kDa protein [Sinorhizobium fredii NGR234]